MDGRRADAVRPDGGGEMNDFSAAYEEFQEAIRRGVQRKKMERLVRPLEIAMRRAFRAQGNKVVQKMNQARRFFAEGERNAEGASQDGSRADAIRPNDAPLREGLPPGEAEKVWAQTHLETSKYFIGPIEATVEKALKLGGMAMLGEMGMKVAFDLKNPRAVNYLRDYGAKLVTKINETTRETLQGLVTQGAEEGWSYKRTASEIISRFEEFAVGKPQEHIDSRAHLIAITETGNAYEEGNRIVAKDLQDAGIEQEKFWSTVGDDKVSDGCRENEEAGWIGIDEEFPSGHQRPLRFPGCRCLANYRMKKEGD